MKAILGALIIMLISALPLTAADRAADFPVPDGWQLAGEIQLYDADDLWKYNNGAAELFLAFEFLQLRVADLSRGEQTVTVGVFDMGTPLNAFGIYGVERPKDAAAQSIGATATLAPPYQGLLLKDINYVKVDAFQGGLSKEVGQSLLAGLAELLPGQAELPGELQLLPAAAKITGSEAYTREGFLGLRELRNCLHAGYQGEQDQLYQIFYLLPETPAGAEKQWDALAASWQPVADARFPLIFKKVPYRGMVWLVSAEAGIYGLTGLEDSPETRALLKQLSASR